MIRRARSASSRPLANWTPPRGWGLSDDDFSAMKCLSEAGRSVALYATQPQQGAERIFGEPALGALRRIGGQHVAGFPPCLRGSHRRVDVRLAEPAVVLRNLVFQNRMVAERVP